MSSFGSASAGSCATTNERRRDAPAGADADRERSTRSRARCIPSQGILLTVHFVEQVDNARLSGCAVTLRNRSAYRAAGFLNTTGSNSIEGTKGTK
jgi:hypothetical protein